MENCKPDAKIAQGLHFCNVLIRTSVSIQIDRHHLLSFLDKSSASWICIHFLLLFLHFVWQHLSSPLVLIVVHLASSVCITLFNPRLKLGLLRISRKKKVSFNGSHREQKPEDDWDPVCLRTAWGGGGKVEYQEQQLNKSDNTSVSKTPEVWSTD